MRYLILAVLLAALFSLLPAPVRAQDFDGDGIPDRDEPKYGTLPDDWDTDDDLLGDGDELTRGTSPVHWDTDGDDLDDKLELDRGRNPLAPADGEEDLDGDGIPYADEYWNGTDPASADPPGRPGCGFWADGDADQWVSPSDLAVITNLIKGIAPSPAYGLPPLADVLDLDLDGFFSPADAGILRTMIAGASLGALPSRPAQLFAITVITPTVPRDRPCQLVVQMKNEAGLPAAGAAVEFAIGAESTGAGRLLGGDGWGDSGRIDFSSAVAAGGRAAVWLRPTDSGVIIVHVRASGCGSPGVGRYAPAISLPASFIVTVP